MIGGNSSADNVRGDILVTEKKGGRLGDPPWTDPRIDVPRSK